MELDGEDVPPLIASEKKDDDIPELLEAGMDEITLTKVPITIVTGVAVAQKTCCWLCAHFLQATWVPVRPHC